MIIALDIITLIIFYFTLLMFWIHPDAYTRGHKPRDWAVSGFFLILILNYLGLLLWVLMYLDGRKKGPGYSVARQPAYSMYGRQQRYGEPMFYQTPPGPRTPKI